jgi:ankyrin repeat protein
VDIQENVQRVMREVRNWGDFGGRTQLHYYCRKGLTSSVKRMLEMKSIDVEARKGGEEDGWTCLMTAALYGHVDTCRLLIDKGAQVNAKDFYGCTPLHWAAERGHIEIVRLLCDHGADIEARYIFGLRPLHRTARNGHISAAKELIEVRSADINARDDDGWTALSFARVNGHADVADYLVSHGGIE